MKRKFVIESLLPTDLSFIWAAAIQVFVTLYTQFEMFEETRRRWGNHGGKSVEVTA